MYVDNIRLMLRKCNHEIYLLLISDFIRTGRNVSAVHFPTYNLTDIKEIRHGSCVANARTAFYKKAEPAFSL
jgi:hypothetical protein